MNADLKRIPHKGVLRGLACISWLEELGISMPFKRKRKKEGDEYHT